MYDTYILRVELQAGDRLHTIIFCNEKNVVIYIYTFYIIYNCINV